MNINSTSENIFEEDKETEASVEKLEKLKMEFAELSTEIGMLETVNNALDVSPNPDLERLIGQLPPAEELPTS